MKFPEKLKLIRKVNNLTQEEFSQSIGISRGNLSGLELGKVQPTQLFINCICLMYNIDKNWLTDDNNEDLNALKGSSGLIMQIMEQYDKLSDHYKKFVENQIRELLEMQSQDNG